MQGSTVIEWVLVGLLGYWLARRNFKKYRASSTRTDGTLKELVRWYFWPDIRNETEARKEFESVRSISGVFAIIMLLAPVIILGLKEGFSPRVLDSHSIFSRFGEFFLVSLAFATIWYFARRGRQWVLFASALGLAGFSVFVLLFSALYEGHIAPLAPLIFSRFSLRGFTSFEPGCGFAITPKAPS
ncbi:MAG: hypothetical protein NTY59_07650 [Alphaproteobacteria bacterium]|nr:hypothetical protein [Alphaproteobacteria bacterium]